MQVKTDTKEKFHVITVTDATLTADMAAELSDLLLSYLQNDARLPGRHVKNVILNMKELQSLDEIAAEKLVKLQQIFYEKNSSFVICEITKPVEDFLDSVNLLEMMNTTPTESEAMDIVQMEEIEREMFDPLPPSQELES
ncbi:MAG TPA: STAS domain-containing protein [Chitinophagaceae bacterium]|nr:STAS domain-containing protein [Chitinophagaceae bacterium]